MQENPRPTRAEANDVANAVYDGTDATMLSGESAQGDYPFASVQTMATISGTIEKFINYDEILLQKSKSLKVDNIISHNIALATVDLANKIDAKFIVATTASGYTAKQISKFRPKAPVVAVCGEDEVANKLTLFNGVLPVTGKKDITVEEMEVQANEVLTTKFDAKSGDVVVLVGGFPAGTTNFIKVITVK